MKRESALEALEADRAYIEALERFAKVPVEHHDEVAALHAAMHRRRRAFIESQLTAGEGEES